MQRHLDESNDMLYAFVLCIQEVTKCLPTHIGQRNLSNAYAGVQKIQSCPNKCILYHGTSCKGFDKCPNYGESVQEEFQLLRSCKQRGALMASNKKHSGKSPRFLMRKKKVTHRVGSLP